MTSLAALTAGSARADITGLSTDGKNFRWSGETAAKAYRVQVRDDSGSIIRKIYVRSSAASCGSGGVCDYDDIDLSSGNYQWRVRAIYTNKTGPFTSWEGFSAGGGSGSSSGGSNSDTVSETAGGSTSGAVSWPAVASAKAYRVHVREASGKISIKAYVRPGDASCTSGNGQCTFTGLKLKASHTEWRVRPIFKNGSSGAFSNWTSLGSAASDSASSGSDTGSGSAGGGSSGSSGTDSVSWPADPKAIAYRVQIRNLSGKILRKDYMRVASVGCSGGKGTCAYETLSLSAGSYEWRVRPLYSNGGNDFTDWRSLEVGGSSGSASSSGSGGTVTVSNGSQLEKALASAVKGQTIQLANGTYSGSFKLRTNGVSIVAQNKLGAKVKSAIDAIGSDILISGLDCTASITINGSNSRVTACRVTGTSGSAISIEGDGSNCRVDHCEVSNFKGRGIVVKMQGGGAYPKSAKIDYNYLHDAQGSTDHDAEPIQIGQSFNNTDQAAGAVVEYNLLQRVSVDPEAISIKSSNNTVRYNTLLDSDANIMIRHGENNLIAGNWCENSRGIVVHDADNQVVGNKCKNSGYYGIRIMGGNLKPSVTSGSGYPYADGTLVSGNDSDRLIIGQTFAGSLSARDTRVEAHTGPIQRGNDVGTVIVSSRSVTAPTPKKLSSSDVGP